MKATHIADNELAILENLFVQDGKLKRRGGTLRVTSSAYAQKLTSLFAYKKAVGTWILLIGARQSIAKLSGTGIVQLPHVLGTVYTDDPMPWVFRQYNDIVYGARKSAGTIQRIDGDVVMDAGIPKPASAPTAVEGAAGVLPAGTYRYVVAFTNTTTGAEGDFSAEVSVTIAANKKIELSNVPVSTNAQVNGKNIYRSLKDASGEYFYVATIGNFTTTYSDNIAEADLGDSVSKENGLPPPAIRGIELWRERLWAHDGRDLFASRAGFPEQFDADFLIQVSPDDGHEIRGLLAFEERLLVGKTNTVRFGVGTDIADFDFDNVLTDKHGVGAGNSMATAGGLAFWLGMDDFYITDGQTVNGIGNRKIRKTLEAIPATVRERAVSYVIPEENRYITMLPQDVVSGFDLEAAYDYKSDRWDIRKRGALGAPVYAGEFFDQNFSRIRYACFDSGHLYQLDSGTTDDGASIVAKLRSKAFGFEAHNLLKWLRRLHILCSTVAENVTVRLYRDEEETAVSSKTVYLLQQRPWKRIGISNKGKMGATVSVEVEYQGAPDFEVAALAFELVQELRSSPPL